MSYRLLLIRIVTFLGGIYFFLSFVLPKTFLGYQVDAYDEQIATAFQAVSAMAVGLGLINLIGFHGSRIVYRRSGAIHSFALLCGLVLMTAITVLDWRSNDIIAKKTEKISVLAEFSARIASDFEAHKKDPSTQAPLLLSFRAQKLKEALESELASLDSLNSNELKEPLAQVRAVIPLLLSTDDASAEQVNESSGKLSEALGALTAAWREVENARYQKTATKSLYAFLYDGLFVALGSAMFSLLGFYIASAAYRAFRVRSLESGLMMLAALLVMLGQIPFGIRLWDELPFIRMWLLKWPNSAAFRAIELGAAVAGLVMAFRMWLSIESESFTKK